MFQDKPVKNNDSQYSTMNKNESDNGLRPQLPELLAPAGTYEKLVTAVHYGADAVYLGGKQLGLREKAGNFTEALMREGVNYAHKHGVKVYVTVNIIAHNRDLEGLPEYLLSLQKMEVDALIISDPGILVVARKVVPELPIHLSTQANVTNHLAASFWLGQGIVRLNLARELSLLEISQIRAQTIGELEIFVHGALCISYSGRCMLSNYMTGRDANRGHCAHPCRFSYALVEEKRPGEYFPVEEDGRGTYIFNSKDLCLLEMLPQLIAAGVNSLKIEGRMKSIFYVGGVVRVYRAALDYLGSLPIAAWEDPAAIRLPELFMEEISRIGTRGMTPNFITERPGSAEMLYLSSRAIQSYEPAAVILQPGSRPLVELRNQVMVGEQVEYMHRGIEVQSLIITALRDEEGNFLEKANPGNRIFLETEPGLQSGEINGIFRRKKF